MRTHSGIRQYATTLFVVALVVTGCGRETTVDVAASPTTQGESPAGGSPTEDSSGCDYPPMKVSYLPWLKEGEKVPPPERHRSGDRALFTWQGPEENRVSVVRHPGTEAEGWEGDSIPVRGVRGFIVWVGDPGVGDLSLLWSEDSTRCSDYSLHLSTKGMSEREAEREIEKVAGSLSE